MGFLSGLTEKIFGGTDNSAQKAQQQANQRSQAFIEAQAKLAREDANRLFAQSDIDRNNAINAAMALMGRSMPMELSQFQNGNVAAQGLMLAGLPQYQNAILGLPVDNNALQPYRAQLPDASFYQTQLPQFGAQPQMQTQVQPQQAPQTDNYTQMLQMALGGVR